MVAHLYIAVLCLQTIAEQAFPSKLTLVNHWWNLYHDRNKSIVSTFVLSLQDQLHPKTRGSAGLEKSEEVLTSVSSKKKKIKS